MFLTELQTKSFDYSTLDPETADYLKDRENSMSKTLESAAEKLGKDLFKAQQKLAQKGYGNFEEWYTSLGLKTTSVYRYINRYKFVSSKLEGSKMLEAFQELSPSLQNEMAKPSAIKEANDAVFNGDVTTHKEYKDLEIKLKEQEKKIEEQQRVIDDYLDKGPEVIEKIVEVEKEVVHPHVEDLRSDNKRLSEALKKEQTKSSNLSWELEELTKRNEFIEKNYNSLIEQRADVDEKSEKYDQLTEAIQNAKGDLDSQQKLIADYKAILKVIKQGNELLLKVSGVAYL